MSHFFPSLVPLSIHRKRKCGKNIQTINLPVHGDGYSLLVEIPGTHKICSSQVCGVKPPSSLNEKTTKTFDQKTEIMLSLFFFSYYPSVWLGSLPGWVLLQGYVSSQNVSVCVVPVLWEQIQNPGSPKQTHKIHSVIHWPLQVWRQDHRSCRMSLWTSCLTC